MLVAIEKNMLGRSFHFPCGFRSAVVWTPLKFAELAFSKIPFVPGMKGKVKSFVLNESSGGIEV